MKTEPTATSPELSPSAGPETSPQLPPLVTRHKRNGKIARLPARLRETLNLMLYDGNSYPNIIKELAQKGCDLNADNLSRWHAGGYQDWLKDQSWLEEMRARLDFASEIVQEKNGRLLQEASLRIAVTQMYNLLSDFDPAVLKSKFAENPGAYTRLLGSLSKLTDGALRFERHRQDEHKGMTVAELLDAPVPPLPPDDASR